MGWFVVEGRHNDSLVPRFITELSDSQEAVLECGLLCLRKLGIAKDSVLVFGGFIETLYSKGDPISISFQISLSPEVAPSFLNAVTNISGDFSCVFTVPHKVYTLRFNDAPWLEVDLFFEPVVSSDIKFILIHDIHSIDCANVECSYQFNHSIKNRVAPDWMLAYYYEKQRATSSSIVEYLAWVSRDPRLDSLKRNIRSK